MQQHKEWYHNPEREHSGIQPILREPLAPRCHPLPDGLVREPSTDHSTDQKACGRRYVKEACRQRGAQAKAGAQYVSGSSKQRILCPTKEATAQVLQRNYQLAFQTRHMLRLTYGESYVGVKHLLESWQWIELRESMPPTSIEFEPRLVQSARGYEQECEYERETDHCGLQPKQIAPACVLDHDASNQRSYRCVSQVAGIAQVNAYLMGVQRQCLQERSRSPFHAAREESTPL